MLPTNKENVLTIVHKHDKMALQTDNAKEREGVRLEVKVEALKRLASSKGWSVPELARRLGVEYSYLFRVLNGEKGRGGGKLFVGLYRLCGEENLNFEDFVFLPAPLSTNNGDPIPVRSG